MSDAAGRIYAAAMAGNDKNPGVPSFLASCMVGQSGNETNNWTSKFFVQNNNCFGYSCDSGSDWQNGCSSGNADNGIRVGNYDSIEDSTNEVVDWWYRRSRDGRGGCPSDLNDIKSVDQYTNILSSAGYFTSDASDYAARIKSFLAKLGGAFTDALNGNPGSLALIAIIIAGTIYYGVKHHWFSKIKKL